MKSVALFLTIFAAVLLTGCSVDRTVRVEPAQAPPLPASLPASMKGYELYSWYAEPEDEWYYTLLTATNRLKTYEEITSAENKADEAGWVKITVKGVDPLKDLLGRLPEGEVVVWIEVPGAARTSGENQNFTFPEQTVVETIEQHARSLGLEFHLAGREAAATSTPVSYIGPSPSPPPNTPALTLPTATFTTTPTVPSPAWSAANPDSLPDENLLIYSEGNRLKSLPDRPVFDRPEISHIYEASGESFGMFLQIAGPVASPDGRYVVLKAPSQGPPPPEPPTWLVDLESDEVEKLEVTGREAAGVGSVTWSPDSCCLSFVVEDTLYVDDVQTGAEPMPIFTQPGLLPLFAGWSPTGEWIAVASDANPQDAISAERTYIYWLISPDGGVIKNLGHYPVGGYGAVSYNLDWSPDGQMLLTPGQCIIAASEDLATCSDGAAYNLTDPTRWLPRAWVRSFLSQQFTKGKRPPFYARSLSPGNRQIAYSLYDDATQKSDLYIFDRVANNHRRVGTVSGYVINEIRWTGLEDFLAVGLDDPTSAIEGGPVILLFDAQEAGPPQVLVEGEDLYLIDVILDYPAAETVPTPNNGLQRADATPVTAQTGVGVDIPDSNYRIIALSHLDPPACCLTVAPDGAQLAFATCRTTVQKVYVQNIDGSGLKEISSLRINDGDGPCPDPAWTPDGQQLAFVNYNGGLYVVNADGTNLTRLEPTGRAPAWSPDGQQIALTAHHSQKGLAIAVMKRDGSDFKLLTNYEARDQRPAWSPDGQRIAFVSDRDGNREIYVMNKDGSEQKRLTDHEAQDWGPVWSPDGRHIVFTSDRQGHNGIYVMNNDGTDQVWLLDTAAPQWWPLDTTRVRFNESR